MAQFGPRIRIGGSLGKAGKYLMPLSGGNLTKLGHATGDVLDNKWTKMALGAALAATGVGAPAAIALMAGAGAGGKLLKKGGNIGDGLRGAAQGAASGAVSAYGGQVLGKLGKLGGVLKGGGDAVGGDLSGIGAARDALAQSINAGGSLGNAAGSAVGDVAGKVASSAGNLASQGSRFRSIGDFVGKNWDKIKDVGAAAENVYGNRQRAALQDEMRERYDAEFAQNEPLRRAALASLQDDTRPDLSSVFASDPARTRRYRRVNIGSAY